MLSAPLGLSPRKLQCPTLSVGRRCPGHSWPQPRKGKKRSFSNTSASTTPAKQANRLMCCRSVMHRKQRQVLRCVLEGQQTGKHTDAD